MIERFHRTLKTALKARLTGPNWVKELPWVLLGLRTTPKEDLGTTSAKLVYGEPLTIPGELVPPKSAKSMHDLLLNFRLNIPLCAPRPASHHTSARLYLSPSLLAAKHVYVRPPITLLLCPTCPHLCQPQNMCTSDEMALKGRYRGLIRVLAQF